MNSWISAWIFVFACGMLIAILSSKEDRRKNRGVAAFTFLIMVIAGLIFVYR